MIQTNLKTFNEIVAAFEITPRTLRYYEYLELLAPKREGRSRFYSQRDIARLKLILKGRRFGFKLEEIRQWLNMYDPASGNNQQVRLWIELADRQIKELESRRTEIEDTIRDLSKLRDDAALSNTIR